MDGKFLIEKYVNNEKAIVKLIKVSTNPLLIGILKKYNIEELYSKFSSGLLLNEKENGKTYLEYFLEIKNNHFHIETLWDGKAHSLCEV